MKRTQLYLEEDMARVLAAESRRRGTTVSLLVRDAVAKVYGRGEGGDRRAIIDRLAGVWADRNDLGEDFLTKRAAPVVAAPAPWWRAGWQGTCSTATSSLTGCVATSVS